jgi:hypothetical protein
VLLTRLREQFTDTPGKELAGDFPIEDLTCQLATARDSIIRGDAEPCQHCACRFRTHELLNARRSSFAAFKVIVRFKVVGYDDTWVASERITD